jgi:predicted MFS family arabinose efflux permease
MLRGGGATIVTNPQLPGVVGRRCDLSPAVEVIPPWTLYAVRERWVLLSILFLVTTSNYFDYFVISVVLDPIKREFHLSDTKLGFLSGFGFAALYAFAALPVARWADRGNRRTIITLTLVGWSVMTALCGLAQSYAQLMFARLGVAATEPGGSPPAQSLVVDYFPPEQRATAISILLQGGSAAGYCVGVALGGYIAARFGWRLAFLTAGLPGLLLAVLVRVKLSEPRNRLGFPSRLPVQEGSADSFTRLKGKRSYVWILLGITAYALMSYATAVFLPSFMIRALNATLAQVSVTWGIAVAIAMVTGALLGGRLADHLSQRDIRWYAWLPALTYGTGAFMYWWTLSMHTLWTFIVVDFPAEILLAVGFSVSFAAIHVVCGTARRASAVALAYFLIMFIGCGFGPLLSGMVSDALTPSYGLQSIRYALWVMVTFLIPASLCMWLAARSMRQDAEQ